MNTDTLFVMTINYFHLQTSTATTATTWTT
jgi:hypothetical protein